MYRWIPSRPDTPTSVVSGGQIPNGNRYLSSVRLRCSTASVLQSTHDVLADCPNPTVVDARSIKGVLAD